VTAMISNILWWGWLILIFGSLHHELVT